MKASQAYQCIVKFDGADLWTNTVQKQRATCTWSDRVAASRLARRLFDEDNAYITRMPVQAGDHEKCIESRWSLSCRNSKGVAHDAWHHCLPVARALPESRADA